MDGVTEYAVSVWAMPIGKELDELPKGWPYEYIQAGGSAKEMTVEMRSVRNRVAVQHVLGRDPEGVVQAGSQVTLNGIIMPVLANEVLSADEALLIFSAYYEGQPIPPGFVSRPR